MVFVSNFLMSAKLRHRDPVTISVATLGRFVFCDHVFTSMRDLLNVRLLPQIQHPKIFIP
jgi:hypothetical protein